MKHILETSHKILCFTVTNTMRNAIIIFTCVALAKAGLEVGPLSPSGRLSVCPSV